MLIECTTRGCLKHSEAKLDKDTGDVICDECGNVIEGVSKFMKVALLSCGQILRGTKKQAFRAWCPSCKENRPLNVREEKAYCEHCDTQVQITAAFLQGLKLFNEAKNKGSEKKEAKKSKKDKNNE